MEQKKLKKLVLKKEIVSRLEHGKMNLMRGGTWTIISPQPITGGTSVYEENGTTCADARCQTNPNYQNTCMGCSENTCGGLATCVPNRCDGYGYGGITVDPTLVVGGCHSMYQWNC
jgi:hypothetical protein